MADNSSKKVIIIGAGVSGLASGVFAARCGFDTTILEQHSIIGGLAQSWSRKGYTFEGGMHWLTGSKPTTPLYKVWHDCGALKENNPIYNKDPFYSYYDGKTQVNFWRDPKKTEEELIKFSPKDKGRIKKMMRQIKAFSYVYMPVKDVPGLKSTKPVHLRLLDFPKMALAGLYFLPLLNTSIREYADKFKSKELRHLVHDPVGANFNALSFAYSLSGFLSGDCGYPIGGSTVLCQNMLDSFTGLGGKIKLRSKVDKIIVENNKVTGVKVGDETISCNAVIISQDQRNAVDTLFDKPLDEKWVHKMKKYSPNCASMYFGAGIKADLSKYPRCLIIPCDEGFTLGGANFTEIRVNNYAGMTHYAPEGKTSITAVLTSETYDFWKKAKEDGTYKAKKEEMVQKLISLIENVIPEIRGNIEVTDFATPLTYERYCSSYKGAWMSTWMKGKPGFTHPSKSKTIEGVYFEGHRTFMPGGLPVTVNSARKAVQTMCKDQKVTWVEP